MHGVGDCGLGILLFSPSCRLVSLLPLTLNITELPLDLLYGLLVTGVLADVIAVGC